MATPLGTSKSFKVNLVKRVKKERSDIRKDKKECKKRRRRHRSAVIADEISVCANTSNNKAPLGHPSLITHLCKLAGVDTSVPPFERPRKAIDEAYYRQYCGGEDVAQPVPPRRARRERGPTQSQTSADTHEAEPFQMRDMYMSLIVAWPEEPVHGGGAGAAEASARDMEEDEAEEEDAFDDDEDEEEEEDTEDSSD
ncbi:hypothetical protein LR48_Vigan650s000100 [Vigna angularis]|uniref:Uncharacterized protein n=1 Tax=Phaseolus angularis TaxID=3914 RepID=A0A0L9TFX1_PHAAN|nr:hypothetical protein LR48_Vigan650s000100 [Vigna angularis]